ncbi:hypothetical protein B0187_03265 [Haemophilus paracuniculus]|uniref:DUF2547 domain-containing protein n=1 Tax=Haemophilus paracuniculus TaxID=734 RepID=A0A1T0ATN4_9PAST|nr:secA translation cis-regulator SecM [Haemophilus paracuniculus]OOR99840.1 hypothetical protein B0187_03265 [Haemophilus paracuniculus]
MSLFRPFSKTPFWSQLVFGLFAMLALPHAQPNSVAENEPKTVVNQSVSDYVQTYFEQESEQQTPFFTALVQSFEMPLQAVRFSEISAKSYRLYLHSTPPIRAGPSA